MQAPPFNPKNKHHYDDNYLEWQIPIGKLEAALNSRFYQPWIKTSDTVLDFGCGGGFLLTQLCCARRIGIEINPHALALAASHGLEVYPSLAVAGNLRPDVVISSHALEHTYRPLDEVRALATVLKPGGFMVIVTPFERKSNWRPNDINQHLYTWSPMNLGNLVREAGLHVISCKVKSHRFPPRSKWMFRYVGQTGYDLLCRIWGSLYWPVTNVRLVAVKPDAGF